MSHSQQLNGRTQERNLQLQGLLRQRPVEKWNSEGGAISLHEDKKIYGGDTTTGDLGIDFRSGETIKGPGV